MKPIFKKLILLLTMALLSIIVSLQSIISSSAFKQQLAKTLSAGVPGEIQLGTLALDFTTGLEVTGIQWLINDQPVVRLKRMLFNIVWRDLIYGQFTLREIRLSSGQVTATPDHFATLTTPEEPKPRPVLPYAPPIPSLLSTLPVHIEMPMLVVEGINLEYALTPTQHISLHNLAIHAALRINPQGLAAKGVLTIEAVTYKDEKGSASHPVSLEINLNGDLHKNGLHLQKSTLRLGELLTLPLDLQIQPKQTTEDLHLEIHADAMELTPVLNLLQPWLPSGLILTGQIKPVLSLNGQWGEEGLNGQMNGSLLLQNLTADLPNLKTHLEASQLLVALNEVSIQANALQKLTTEFNLKGAHLTQGKNRIEDLSLLAVTTYRPDGTINGHMRIQADQATLDQPNTQIGKSRFFLQGQATLDGDLVPQQIETHGTAQIQPLTIQQKATKTQAAIQAIRLSWQGEGAAGKLSGRVHTLTLTDGPRSWKLPELIFGVTTQLNAIDPWTPMQADVRMILKGLSGSWGENRLKGGKGRIRLAMQPGKKPLYSIKSALQAEQVGWSETRKPSGLRDVHLGLDLAGQSLDNWTLNRVYGAFPGLEAKARGKLFGITNLLKHQGTLREQLSRIFLELAGEVRLDLAKETQLLSALGIQKGQGNSALDLTLFKPVNGPFVLRMTAEPKEISLQQAGVAVTGINGKVPISKKLGVDKPVPTATSAPRRAFSLERITSPLSTKADQRLRIASVEVGGVQIEQIGVNLNFLENAIRGQNLEMQMLGGTIGGNFLLEGIKPARIHAILEGVGIDLNQLLPSRERITGDSSVDFVSRYTLRFDRKSGKLNLGRTDISLIFTRIGKEALDHLLKFLDPQESNPALINARSKVSYANPSRMDLQLTQGTIKLKIDFREGLVSTLNIDRIPLTILGHIEQIQSQLVPLENLARLLEEMGIANLDLEAHEPVPAP
ncbi:MAG: hypothetical protein HQL94_03445 [Magnetococcales bacterium]|nr:hypothetical protein [Magnetococcales bacterium]